MNISLKEWNKLYVKVHYLGKILRASRATYTQTGLKIAALHELSSKDEHHLQWELNNTLKQSSKYLKHCGITMSQPLWHYERTNPETHASSPEFKYSHLTCQCRGKHDSYEA